MVYSPPPTETPETGIDDVEGDNDTVPSTDKTTTTPLITARTTQVEPKVKEPEKNTKLAESAPSNDVTQNSQQSVAPTKFSTMENASLATSETTESGNTKLTVEAQASDQAKDFVETTTEPTNGQSTPSTAPTPHEIPVTDTSKGLVKVASGVAPQANAGRLAPMVAATEHGVIIAADALQQEVPAVKTPEAIQHAGNSGASTPDDLEMVVAEPSAASGYDSTNEVSSAKATETSSPEIKSQSTASSAASVAPDSESAGDCVEPVTKSKVGDDRSTGRTLPTAKDLPITAGMKRRRSKKEIGVAYETAPTCSPEDHNLESLQTKVWHHQLRKHNNHAACAACGIQPHIAKVPFHHCPALAGDIPSACAFLLCVPCYAAQYSTKKRSRRR